MWSCHKNKPIQKRLVKTPPIANIIKAAGVFLGVVYLLYGRNPVGSTSARKYGHRAAAVSRSAEGGFVHRDKEAWETQEEFEAGGYAYELARTDKYGGPKFRKGVEAKEGLSLSRGKSASYSTGQLMESLGRTRQPSFSGKSVWPRPGSGILIGKGGVLSGTIGGGGK